MMECVGLVRNSASKIGVVDLTTSNRHMSFLLQKFSITLVHHFAPASRLFEGMSLLANLVSESIDTPAPSIRAAISSKSSNYSSSIPKGKGKVVPEKNKMIAAVVGATITSLTSKSSPAPIVHFSSTIEGSQPLPSLVFPLKSGIGRWVYLPSRYTQLAYFGMLQPSSRRNSIEKSYGRTALPR